MATYITEAELTTYCNERGLTVPATPLPFIQQATDFITATYYDNLIGSKTDEAQELLFPRVDDYGDTIDETSLKKAACSLSLRAENDSLFEDSTKRVTKEKLEGLEVEYSDDGVSKTHFSDVNSFMRPYLIGSGSAVRVVRS